MTRVGREDQQGLEAGSLVGHRGSEVTKQQGDENLRCGSGRGFMEGAHESCGQTGMRSNLQRELPSAETEPLNVGGRVGTDLTARGRKDVKP